MFENFSTARRRSTGILNRALNVDSIAADMERRIIRGEFAIASAVAISWRNDYYLFSARRLTFFIFASLAESMAWATNFSGVWLSA